MTEESTTTQEIRVSGSRLLARMRAILHEGNVRHVTVTSEKGGTLFEFPLTLGILGALFLPTASAIGAVAALLGSCTIRVERTE